MNKKEFIARRSIGALLVLAIAPLILGVIPNMGEEAQKAPKPSTSELYTTGLQIEGGLLLAIGIIWLIIWCFSGKPPVQPKD